LNIKINTKPYFPTLIASVILFIMVFLPWLTVSFQGFGSASANGMHDWGILTFIMSILGAAAAFLAEKRTRALGSLLAGVLALLGVLIYMRNLGNGAGVGAGLILALIVSLALIALAYMDFKNIPLPIKMGGTPKSNPPPAPPTPPAPPAK
jgi:hypothetical protein